ncbi:hypothetical protein PUMCH_001272 [Australozyma saopauloensis]|uniref:candidapepsin n=1 Tax=Australozyma saopauloensis TaxID=291208 RepID=A0AAX4H6E1_9ASCO|nr:hypothetical protein PUMCH_001272 [[Candida] saopauloensis]
MLFSSILISLSLAGISAAQAVAVPKPFALDFEISRPDISKGIQKRDNGSIFLPLLNDQIVYNAVLELGSSRQKQIVQLDTGSSDLWVVGSNAACLEVGKTKPAASNTCTSFGSFNTGLSLSFKVNLTIGPFVIEYLDKSGASGVYGLDSILFGNYTIPNMTFGVVNQTSSSNPVFGIGLRNNEASLLNTQMGTYENFPMQLKSLGYIKKTAYSMFLNAANATKGSILFGAIDQKKYTGKLFTMPIVEELALQVVKNRSLLVKLDLLKIKGKDFSIPISNQSIAVTLDSGSQVSYFPQAVVDAISKMMGAKPFKGHEKVQTVDCAYMKLNMTLAFDFSGGVLEMPLSNFVGNMTSKLCYLGIRNAETSILGDNFLSGAYVVYDYEDMEISIAKASYNTDSQIEVISSTVPSAVRVPNYSQTSVASSVSSQVVQTSVSPSGQTLKSDGHSNVAGVKIMLFSIFLGAILML